MSIRRMAVRVLTAAGVAVLLAVTPAAANAGRGTTQVDGLLELDQSGACPVDPSAAGTYVVTGTLEGCWYVDTFNVDHENSAGGFVASGTEHFTGCLGDRCGHLFTTYTFTSKYLPDGTEAHGRCHHPITGGDGDFAGVSGVINMHDVSNTCAVYSGHIDG